MIVFMTLIPDESLEEAKRLTHDLESAVQLGDVETADALSSQLREMLAATDGVTVEESEWESLNARIRSKKADYSADFILSPSVCMGLASLVAGDELVGGKLFGEASTRKLHLLQIPYLEE